MKGTRLSVLQELEDWLHDERGKRFLWLDGGVGTGKSAIAQTFAETCFADGTLGASFFCSRGCGTMDIQLILPTLAFQLAHRYPRFREELLKILGENHDIGQESLDSQMEKLIVSPFEATQIRTLIIIDALDQCNWQRDRQPAIRFLSSLSQHMAGIPNVKFFVTGRPLGRTWCGASEGPPVHCAAKEIRLRHVKYSLVDDDIKLILRTGLKERAKMGRHCNLPRDWPSSHDIDILCSKTGGIFLCASTFVESLPSRYDLTIRSLAWDMTLIYCRHSNLYLQSSKIVGTVP